MTEHCTDIDIDSIDYEMAHIIVHALNGQRIPPELIILRLREEDTSLPPASLLRMWEGHTSDIQQECLQSAGVTTPASHQPQLPAQPQPLATPVQPAQPVVAQANPGPSAAKSWQPVPSQPPTLAAKAAAPKETSQIGLHTVSRIKFPGQNGSMEFRMDFDVRARLEPIAYAVERIYGVKISFVSGKPHLFRVSPYHLTSLPDIAANNLANKRYNNFVGCIAAWWDEIHQSQGRGPELTQYIWNWEFRENPQFRQKTKARLNAMAKEARNPSSINYEIPLPPPSALQWYRKPQPDDSAPAKPTPVTEESMSSGPAQSVHNKAQQPPKTPVNSRKRQRSESRINSAYRNKGEKALQWPW